MKSTLEGVSSSLHIADENISELEDMAIETIWNKHREERHNTVLKICEILSRAWYKSDWSPRKNRWGKQRSIWRYFI